MIRRGFFILVASAFLVVGASVFAFEDNMPGPEAGTALMSGGESIGGEAIPQRGAVEMDRSFGPSQDLKPLAFGPVPGPNHSGGIPQGSTHGHPITAGFDPSKGALQPKDNRSARLESIEISTDQIRDLMERYLKRHMPWELVDAHIVDIQVANPVILPGGTITASIVEASGHDSLPGRIPLAITFRSDGAHEKRTWGIARIKAMGEAVFVKQSIRRRRPITADDVELRKVDLGSCPSQVLVRLDEVIGSRATKSISEDTLMTADMVALPPVVQRRAVVMVTAEKGGLKIKTLGEAKEDGRVGDLVRVMNLESKKVIYARVLDAQTVKVEF